MVVNVFQVFRANQALLLLLLLLFWLQILVTIILMIQSKQYPSHFSDNCNSGINHVKAECI